VRFPPRRNCLKNKFFPTLGHTGARGTTVALSPWRIKSIQGAKDEAITRYHVQESARAKNSAASHDLQALRRANLFA